MTIVTNIKIDENKINFAKNIISKMYDELSECIKKGHGPFLASIYQKDKLIAKCANSVVLHKKSARIFSNI